MTGRELIIYILNNGLEDEQVFKNGRFIGFLTISETAQKLGIGMESVKTMLQLGMIDNIEDGELIPEQSIVKLLEKKERL